jgi:hypothetical protein
VLVADVIGTIGLVVSIYLGTSALGISFPTWLVPR